MADHDHVLEDVLEDDTIPIPRNPNRLHTHTHTHTSAPAPTPTHRLTLTSYSHRRGPLVPAPTPGLTFDVRALPNPPKRLREMCVGTDKALRAAFMADGRCVERVREVERAVRAVLGRCGGGGEGAGGEGSSLTLGEGGGDGKREEGREEQEEEEEEEEVGEDEEGRIKPDVHIRVGICCEMGRHRSVACVEELARVAWPPAWEIEVVHRDLKRRRSERDKPKRSRKVQSFDAYESA